MHEFSLFFHLCQKLSLPHRSFAVSNRNDTKMGTAYRIKCKHCGTELRHSASAGCGLYPKSAGCGGPSIVETDLPIRCPACLHVLNRTEREFNEQVEVVMMWD